MSQHSSILRTAYAALYESGNRTAGPTGQRVGEIRRDMKRLGMTRIGMHRAESAVLPRTMYPTEKLEAIAYGHDERGGVTLAATNKRIIRLSRIKSFVDIDDIAYSSITGLTYFTGWFSSVLLHTRKENIRIVAFNQKAARLFVRFVEDKCLSNVLPPSKLWSTQP